MCCMASWANILVFWCTKSTTIHHYEMDQLPIDVVKSIMVGSTWFFLLLSLASIYDASMLKSCVLNENRWRCSRSYNRIPGHTDKINFFHKSVNFWSNRTVLVVNCPNNIFLIEIYHSFLQLLCPNTRYQDHWIRPSVVVDWCVITFDPDVVERRSKAQSWAFLII